MSALLRYQPGTTPTHRMIQTSALNERMIRHTWPCEQRTDEHVHMNSTGGAGVATGDDRYAAIHKQARQKMPKGG